ncbi:MAG: undecaprenyl/decaprenyl-phosphate alpha-N-acetylglucosaminyl 1-phosphate transferase [Cyanobacteria bacterium HKST-UBA03]|nr:undecaprenyl/decaprenyl-phosphate alpha-N-acetylglucosaminyl 1-phosphate transferase [Cyanobacteria bacterium HKST-UBA03]
MDFFDLLNLISTKLSSPWVIAGGFMLALVASGILTPIIRSWAIDAGLYDIPNDRKIHKYPIPRLGGVAIWGGFLAALALMSLAFRNQLGDATIIGTILGGTIIFFVGLIDDIYNLSPYLKLFGQMLAALVAINMGVHITALDLPFSKILLLQILSVPFTLVWLIGVSNAFNFIDGVDGLAGGVTMISALTMAVVGLYMNQPVAALVSACLAGATLGFLNFNFYPARIFMGDSGALFCGFVLACISITGVLKTLTMSMLLPVVVLTVPILDITFSTLRRLFKLQSPFQADADHLHHRLLKAGLSQLWVVFALYGICAVAGMLATYYIGHLGNYLMVLFSVVVLAALTVFLSRLLSGREAPRRNLTATMEHPSPASPTSAKVPTNTEPVIGNHNP